MKNIITLGFLLICFSAIGQIKPYQIESDSVRRMVLVSDTVNEGGTQYDELLYYSIDSLVRQITKDTLKMDSALWVPSGTYSISPKDAPLNNILLGTNAGENITTGNYNFIIGDNMPLITTEIGVTGIGLQNMRNATSANYATGIGQQNMFTATSANYATGLGFQNMYSATNAAVATGIGLQNMRNATSANYATGIGQQNMYSATNANYATGLGFQNMYFATSANSATGIGYRNMYNAASALVTTGFGQENMYSATNANYATGIGLQNMYTATSPNYATGIGHRNMYSATSALSATGIGYQNMFTATSASYATGIGYQNMFNATSANNAIAIGRENGFTPAVSQDNSIYLGYRQGYTTGAANRLMIGMTQDVPLIYGEFNNSLARINGSFEVTDKTGTATNVASWDGDKIIDSGTSIASLANTDSQTLSFTSPNLSISGGNSVDLSALESDFNAMDSYSFGASGWVYRAEDALGNVLGEPLIIVAGTGLTMSQTTTGFTLNSTATSSPWTDFGTYLSSNSHDITAEDVNLTYRATDAISLNGRDASGWVTDVPLGTGLSLSSGILSNTLPGLWSDLGTYVKLGSATDDVFIQSALLDEGQSPGTSGQILSSTGSATDWIDFEKPFTLFTASNTSFPSSGEINLTESIASSYSASGTNITVPSNGYYEIIVNFDYTTGGSEGDQFDVTLRDGVTQLEKTEVPVGPAFLNGGNGSILAVEYLTTSSSVSVYVFNVTGKSVEVERMRVSFKKLD